MISQVRADFLTRIVREGQFVTLDQGFVFHYRERGADGSLRGIFIQDRRDPQHINTYIAEVGVNVQKDKQNYLILQKGSVQRQTPGEVDPAMVSFESYAIDLTQFGSEAEGAPLKPREYATLDLFNLDRNSDYVKNNIGRLLSELQDRFINPLYALVFGLIGFAALGQPQTTRQARGLRLGLVIAGVIILRIAGFGASALVAKSLWAIWLVYALPLSALVLALFAITKRQSR
jgi:lipopolysaccharide export system permease protein